MYLCCAMYNIGYFSFIRCTKGRSRLLARIIFMKYTLLHPQSTLNTCWETTPNHHDSSPSLKDGPSHVPSIAPSTLVSATGDMVNKGGLSPFNFNQAAPRTPSGTFSVTFTLHTHQYDAWGFQSLNISQMFLSLVVPSAFVTVDCPILMCHVIFDHLSPNLFVKRFSDVSRRKDHWPGSKTPSVSFENQQTSHPSRVQIAISSTFCSFSHSTRPVSKLVDQTPRGNTACPKLVVWSQSDLLISIASFFTFPTCKVPQWFHSGELDR